MCIYEFEIQMRDTHVNIQNSYLMTLLEININIDRKYNSKPTCFCSCILPTIKGDNLCLKKDKY